MANPVGFEGANHIMLAPEGSTPEECSDLPTFNDGHQNISCWRLTKEEIEAVNQTGVVWLSVQGTGMPPVCVGAKGFLSVDGREPIAEPYIKPTQRKEMNAPDYNCEGCGKGITIGKDKYHDSSDIAFCYDCSPTYEDLLKEPEGYWKIQDEEHHTPESAKEFVDNHIKNGGSITDKLASL